MLSRPIQFLRARLDPHAVMIQHQITPLNAASLRTTRLTGLIVSAALSLVIVIQYIAAVVFGPGAALMPTISLTFGIPLTLCLLIAPFAFAAISAILAATHVRSGVTPMLALTNLSGRAVFQGYFLAVMVRLQMAVVLLIAIMPAYGLIQLGQAFAVAGSNSAIPNEWIFSLTPLVGILYPIQVLGICLLASCWGVDLGMGPLSRAEAAAVAVVVVLVYMIITAVLLGAANYPLQLIPYARPIVAVTAALFLVAARLALTALPFWLALLTLRRQRALPHFDTVHPAG
jgi:hypothetical protein